MIVALVLLTSVRQVTSAEWGELMPWSKSMPEEEFKKHIEIRLVKKDWLPQGFTVPEGDGLYDTYPGSTEEAYKIFREAPLYEYFTRPLDTAQELLSSQFGYDPQLDSIVIVHTISGTADTAFIKNTVAALGLRNAVKHFNVFTVNMPGLRTLLHQTGIQSAFGRVGNMYGLARTIGGFFNKAIQKAAMVPGQIHFIGFSLSSQVCGYVARNIMNNNHGLKVGSIVALDPHSNGFSSVMGQLVSSKDARVVHAYHTNSMIMGTFFRQATADFVFNNGNVQPGCAVKMVDKKEENNKKRHFIRVNKERMWKHSNRRPDVILTLGLTLHSRRYSQNTGVVGGLPYSIVQRLAREELMTKSVPLTVMTTAVMTLARVDKALTIIVLWSVSDYMCSHRKSVLILWYVILNKHQFVARSCKSYLLFAACLCQSHDTVLMTYPDSDLLSGMTFYAKGLYYLQTREHKPYGYGPPGADCPLKTYKDTYDKEHADDKEVFNSPL